ncbi:unnamed protein product, partial [Rhizoctonia solani]
QQTPLRAFLQASLLSTDSETKEEESKGKVTITTCHAAKGLEWPVVIVPAVEGGTYPFYRAEDVEEERRLLYVACTRAQALLYLTHSSSRMVGGETRKTTLSEFVTCIIQQDLRNLPLLTKDELVVFGKILSRAVPSNEVIQKGLREFRRVPRLRDHERDEPVDTDEASNPSWKYTANESGNASRAARPSSIAASHEGFTTFSLASVRSFDQTEFLNELGANHQTEERKRTCLSESRTNCFALVKTGTSTSKVAVAPPKPANSAFRPPTFIANGATPNAASAVAGAKRRLGMGHFAGGALSAQKFRQVEKGVKSGNDT